MPDRIKKEYEIELMSDLCPGSGFSYAGIIDSDVSFDTFGFPYISGKRIKGCMRETAKLLGIGNIDKLFGIGREGEYESKENNKIIVSNAVPKGIPAASELKKAIDNVAYSFIFRMKHRGRTHFVLPGMKFSFTDQSSVLCPVYQILKYRGASNPKTAGTFAGPHDAGLFDTVCGIFAFNIINDVSDT